ncbi:hypothetical protein [uncultured Microbacterium sp.]|uniref:hypothetical protein n=1 Tax=uncultured Microbacterium sp. TaxID=191216 RepID=UPI0035CAE276
MTFWELIRAAGRFWTVLLAGAVLTAAVGYAAVNADPVYFTRTELVFLAPTSPLYPNALRTQSEDIIDTAGVIAKRVSGPGRVTKFASPDVTLVGMGVREGWALRLPDTGGQWASNFATQRLLLDVVGPSRDAVRAIQEDVISRVSEELDSLQRDAGVNPANDITVITAPQSTVIYAVTGNKVRALTMTAAIGIGVTISVIVVLEYRRRRRAMSTSVPRDEQSIRLGRDPVTAG